MSYFDIGFARGDPDHPPTDDGFSDYFQVSYLDTTDASFDRAFVAVNVGGFYDPDPSDPYPLPVDLGNGLSRFAADITDLAGRSGTLFFDLNEGDDGYYASARVDNVRIDVATVPEPGTWLLIGVGLAVAAFRPRRSHTQPLLWNMALFRGGSHPNRVWIGTD